MCIYNEKAMRPRRGDGEKQDGEKQDGEKQDGEKQGKKMRPVRRRGWKPLITKGFGPLWLTGWS
jgi:hypothetical protein